MTTQPRGAADLEGLRSAADTLLRIWNTPRDGHGWKDQWHTSLDNLSNALAATKQDSTDPTPLTLEAVTKALADALPANGATLAPMTGDWGSIHVEDVARGVFARLGGKL